MQGGKRGKCGERGNRGDRCTTEEKRGSRKGWETGVVKAKERERERPHTHTHIHIHTYIHTHAQGGRREDEKGGGTKWTTKGGEGREGVVRASACTAQCMHLREVWVRYAFVLARACNWVAGSTTSAKAARAAVLTRRFSPRDFPADSPPLFPILVSFYLFSFFFSLPLCLSRSTV